jgi:hypothetical protein
MGRRSASLSDGEPRRRIAIPRRRGIFAVQVVSLGVIARYWTEPGQRAERFGHAVHRDVLFPA